MADDAIKDKRVDQLAPGDILSSSGFVVTQWPVRTIKIGANERLICGHYPGGSEKQYVWRAATIVKVRTDNVPGQD